MPTIFGDRRKKMGSSFAKMEDGRVELESDAPDSIKLLASDVLDAIKEGSAEKLAQAFKAMYLECEKYEED